MRSEREREGKWETYLEGRRRGIGREGEKVPRRLIELVDVRRVESTATLSGEIGESGGCG